ncbi:MAG TPA: ATP synthase subunit I [Steroidobacteraceae bacterium]|nr:ATP synthase subunit I [Steroidobacteraceae bacterium]
MITAGDGGIRRIAMRILMAQAATTILIAAVCALAWGTTHAKSALAGGLIGLIANAFMTLSALRPTASAAGALGRLMFGQLMKVMVTVGLLAIVARGGWANWPALLVAYAATLLMFWFVPTWTHRPRRVRG